MIDLFLTSIELAQKPYPLMMPFFLTAILSISVATSQRDKNDTFGIPKSNWFKNTIFYSKIPTRKLGLMWPWPDPVTGQGHVTLTGTSSVVDLHGIRLQNGYDFLILRAKVTRNHVPHVRKRCFDSRDLSWPIVTFRDPTLTRSFVRS